VRDRLEQKDRGRAAAAVVCRRGPEIDAADLLPPERKGSSVARRLHRLPWRGASSLSAADE
jgi:hypothetical protein